MLPAVREKEERWLRDGFVDTWKSDHFYVHTYDTYVSYVPTASHRTGFEDGLGWYERYVIQYA